MTQRLAGKVAIVTGGTSGLGAAISRRFGAEGATVFATWTFPDGSTQDVESVTSSSGQVTFRVNDGKKGTYTLTVVDVVLDGHRFDTEISNLTASIKAK